MKISNLSYEFHTLDTFEKRVVKKNRFNSNIDKESDIIWNFWRGCFQSALRELKLDYGKFQQNIRHINNKYFSIISLRFCKFSKVSGFLVAQMS